LFYRALRSLTCCLFGELGGEAIATVGGGVVSISKMASRVAVVSSAAAFTGTAIFLPPLALEIV